ncbi:MAG: hypothetical protein ACREX0_14725, partial [Noviherbaspirillum sp.]
MPTIAGTTKCPLSIWKVNILLIVTGPSTLFLAIDAGHGCWGMSNKLQCHVRHGETHAGAAGGTARATASKVVNFQRLTRQVVNEIESGFTVPFADEERRSTWK